MQTPDSVKTFFQVFIHMQFLCHTEISYSNDLSFVIKMAMKRSLSFEK